MKLDIIDSEKYFKTRKARNVAILLFTILMILMGGGASESRPGILQSLGIFDIVFIPFTIIFILTGIYIFISYIYSRQSTKIGKMEINIKEISIDTKTFSKKINMNNVDSIKIIHNTYVGEDYKNNPIDNYHGNNWILIKTKMDEQKFEFKIDSHYKNVQLKKLIDGLKANKVNIEYTQI